LWAPYGSVAGESKLVLSLRCRDRVCTITTQYDLR
jgi:hypothetical protein